MTDTDDLGRLERRLRKRRRALERTNPLNDPDGYRGRFREVIGLEAQVRDARHDPTDAPGTGSGR